MHWRRLVEVVVDGALVTAAFYAAYIVAVEGTGTINQRHLFIVTLPILLAARFLTFIPFGLYRSVWRYAGARDAALVLAAVVVSEVVAYAVIDATRDFGDFPTSIFVIDALLCALLVGAARFGERAFVGLVAGIARPEPPAPGADRRRRPKRPKPAARAARDTRRARRRRSSTTTRACAAAGSTASGSPGRRARRRTRSGRPARTPCWSRFPGRRRSAWQPSRTHASRRTSRSSSCSAGSPSDAGARRGPLR